MVFVFQFEIEQTGVRELCHFRYSIIKNPAKTKMCLDFNFNFMCKKRIHTLHTRFTQVGGM